MLKKEFEIDKVYICLEDGHLMKVLREVDGQLEIEIMHTTDKTEGCKVGDIVKTNWDDNDNLPFSLASLGVPKTNEMVDHPSHYNQSKYEVIKVIDDWYLDFSEGCVLKYVARCNYKGKKEEDLKKAIRYCELIEQRERRGIYREIPKLDVDLVLKEWNLSPMLTLAIRELYSAVNEEEYSGWWKVREYIEKELDRSI